MGVVVDRPSGTATAHHALSPHESLIVLQTDMEAGLRDSVVARRQRDFGSNLLPQTPQPTWLARMAGQIRSPLIVILLVSGAVSWVLGERVDASVIFGVVALNAVIGFVQEMRAEAELNALRSMVGTRARVRRGGLTSVIDSSLLVPGDVVLLEAGDRVPADLRVLSCDELTADESTLTGESLPVSKDELTLPPETPVADRRNMLFAGTLVTAGQGIGVAVATGASTELGEIHRLVGDVDPLDTPLTQKLAHFSTILMWVILGLAAITFAIGLFRGEPVGTMVSAAVALAVGAIPEGLPAAVTITLAIGVARMAKRRAVVRNLPAVETLGSTTVICTDKTGTLTQNRMTVRRIWTVDGEYLPGDVAGLQGDPAATLTVQIGALCNDATASVDAAGSWEFTGDPTESALLLSAYAAGCDVDGLRMTHPRRATTPFTSERQHMATLHAPPAPEAERRSRLPVEGECLLVKGAVERVVGLCRGQLCRDGTEEALDQDAILAAARGLSEQGMRVLAMAYCSGGPGSAPSVGELPDGPHQGDAGRLVFAGLQGMLDPPRDSAREAVAACRRAGISVRMITGDHPATAQAVARDVGLLDAGEPADRSVSQGEGADSPLTGISPIITGAELAELSRDDFERAAAEALVFARVSPQQKLNLVVALQARGEVVAMTGDGVNDAPALRQADIGIAMGRVGTEVAKDAADMVLTDDDFSTIEAAVEEGRGVYENLTKFIAWTLPTNIAEGLVILVAIGVGTTLPILPVQILWINMTTAVFLGLMLAFEPKEADLMIRPPRDPGTPLLTKAVVVRIVLVSVLLVGGALWIFDHEIAVGASPEEARTAAVNLVVVNMAMYLFSCRSLTQPIVKIGPFSNPWVLGGVAVQACGQYAFTYSPWMNDLFSSAPITGAVWLQIFALAAAATLVVESEKIIRVLALNRGARAAYSRP